MIKRQQTAAGEMAKVSLAPSPIPIQLGTAGGELQTATTALMLQLMADSIEFSSVGFRCCY